MLARESRGLAPRPFGQIASPAKRSPTLAQIRARSSGVAATEREAVHSCQVLGFERSGASFSYGMLAVRGLCWMTAISRANRVTRRIRSANRAAGDRRRIFNTSFRRRLSMIPTFNATGRSSAFLADGPNKTHDMDFRRMPT